MTPAYRSSLSAVALILVMGTAHAKLTRFVVEEREQVAPSKPSAPAYEILRGYYEGELDPMDHHNRIITDISKAERAAGGKVGYTATFAIALPRDPKLASGILAYDVPNRGYGEIAADAQGHIRVVSGWQGDIVPQKGAQTATVPIARNPDGTPVTSPVLQRFLDIPSGVASIPIVGGIGRPTPRPLPLSLDTSKSRLFHQVSEATAPVDVAPEDWAFADCRSTPFPGIPDPGQLCVRGGFDSRLAYTVVYEGKDPKVLGIGFAAVRDLNAFLRYSQADDQRTPNPVAGLVRWSIMTGTSQSGNFVRSFISLGFNAAENGRIVFDGANPNIAARQVPLNVRFGVPGGAAGPYELGSEGTLWWTRYDDDVRGRGTSSLLDRCMASKTCPKIVETFGASELWGLRMSPNLVGTDARADLALPSNVRRYYFPSVSHNGSASGGFPLAGDKPFPGAPACRLAWNPNPSSDTRRAILKLLTNWVGAGKTPPPSRYPTMKNGDLVEPTPSAMGWPTIPNAPSPAGKLNAFVDYDFGAGFNYADLSGVASTQPPRLKQIMQSLVVRVNADGNEMAGIPSVQLLVPIGTYTGWNELSSGYGAGGPCGFIGGFIPFAKTENDRAQGDPRASLQARYGDHAGFVARVRSAASEQVGQGWLLEEDARRIVEQAENSDVLR
jgi:hypothetical protein